MLTENSDIDQFLLDLRSEGKEYHTEQNEKILEEIISEEVGLIEVSNYSPFVSLTFEDEKADDIKEILNDLATFDIVTQIDVINYAEEVPQIDTNFERLGLSI